MNKKIEKTKKDKLFAKMCERCFINYWGTSRTRICNECKKKVWINPKKH